jgi:hypothetical protein
LTKQTFIRVIYNCNHGPDRAGDERLFISEQVVKDLSQRGIVRVLGTEDRPVPGNPEDAMPEDLKQFLLGKIGHPSQAAKPEPKMSNRRA